jgi:phage gp36-like protein
MPYVTQAQYIARFGQAELIELTDRSPEPMDAVDSAVYNAAANSADGVVDGYLRSRYVVPMASVSEDLRFHCGAIVRAILYRDNRTQIVQLDYDNAMLWLKDVQAGRVLLDAATATPAPGVGIVGLAQFNTAQNIFSEAY